MALNRQVFRTRALTAAVFAAVMLAGLFVSGYSFLILFSVIAIGCLFEFSRLVRMITPAKANYFLPFALPYIIIPVAMMVYLSGIYSHAEWDVSNYNFLLPVAVILSIWINDTMAYITGSLIGKTPLTKISPKKTIEGTVGGILLCILTMGTIGYFIPAAQELPLRHWLWIAGISASFGTVGDIVESKIKRLAGQKDSGSFMPGHGGFLDRFDSLLIALPFVWLYAILFIL